MLYSIKISSLAIKKIDNFSLLREHYIKNKFCDTWIFNESEILDTCLVELDEWTKWLYEYLETSLLTWFLGNIQKVTEKYEQRQIVLFYKNHTLILDTKKWLNENIITIEDIVIRS